jgi:biotin carboxyl carrier protein
MIYEVIVGAGGKPHRLELERADAGWTCRLDGKLIAIDALIPRRDVLSLILDGRSYEIKREQSATDLYLWVEDMRLPVELRDPRSLRSRRHAGEETKGPIRVLAPMPGRVVRLLAEEGHDIEAGAGVVVVEAMKMQNEIKSPKKGRVKKISATLGAAVNPGDVLAVIE